MKSIHPTRFNMVASGEVSPRSVRAISAQNANPFAMACAGARHNNQYAVAQRSGGLSAPQQPSR